ncbi:MAG: hypothetical protein NTW21_44075 [Verrucomicrobia bacterium]|nr:hypothetical protein [Verrucomicrobiota bacterium]
MTPQRHCCHPKSGADDSRIRLKRQQVPTHFPPGSGTVSLRRVVAGQVGLPLAGPFAEISFRLALQRFCNSYYSGSKEFMAESFFKSLEGDSSLVGLSACGCTQTGVDPMTFSNSEMILPSMILPNLSSSLQPSVPSPRPGRWLLQLPSPPNQFPSSRIETVT